MMAPWKNRASAVGRLGEVGNVRSGEFKFEKLGFGRPAALEKAGWQEWARCTQLRLAAFWNQNPDDRFQAMNPKRGRSLRCPKPS